MEVALALARCRHRAAAAGSLGCPSSHSSLGVSSTGARLRSAPSSCARHMRRSSARPSRSVSSSAVGASPCTHATMRRQAAPKPCTAEDRRIPGPSPSPSSARRASRASHRPWQAPHALSSSASAAVRRCHAAGASPSPAASASAARPAAARACRPHPGSVGCCA